MTRAISVRGNFLRLPDPESQDIGTTYTAETAFMRMRIEVPHGDKLEKLTLKRGERMWFRVTAESHGDGHIRKFWTWGIEADGRTP